MGIHFDLQYYYWFFKKKKLSMTSRQVTPPKIHKLIQGLPENPEFIIGNRIKDELLNK